MNPTAEKVLQATGEAVVAVAEGAAKVVAGAAKAAAKSAAEEQMSKAVVGVGVMPFMGRPDVQNIPPERRTEDISRYTGISDQDAIAEQQAILAEVERLSADIRARMAAGDLQGARDVGLQLVAYRNAMKAAGDEMDSNRMARAGVGDSGKISSRVVDVRKETVPGSPVAKALQNSGPLGSAVVKVLGLQAEDEKVAFVQQEEHVLSPELAGVETAKYEVNSGIQSTEVMLADLRGRVQRGAPEEAKEAAHQAKADEKQAAMDLQQKSDLEEALEKAREAAQKKPSLPAEPLQNAIQHVDAGEVAKRLGGKESLGPIAGEILFAATGAPATMDVQGENLSDAEKRIRDAAKEQARASQEASLAGGLSAAEKLTQAMDSLVEANTVEAGGLNFKLTEDQTALAKAKKMLTGPDNTKSSLDEVLKSQEFRGELMELYAKSGSRTPEKDAAVLSDAFKGDQPLHRDLLEYLGSSERRSERDVELIISAARWKEAMSAMSRLKAREDIVKIFEHIFSGTGREDSLK